jgi:glyoxylase-like metal-dependent hydrolase (beta-lactamase superfamily II)
MATVTCADTIIGVTSITIINNAERIQGTERMRASSAKRNKGTTHAERARDRLMHERQVLPRHVIHPFARPICPSALYAETAARDHRRMIRRFLLTLALAQPLAAQPELTAARGLIHAVPGDLPTAIGYLNVAEDSWPLSVAVADAPTTTVSSPTPVFQVRFARGWIMVDAGMDREIAAARDDTSGFSDDRYARAVRALQGADLIVVTHEHWDHIATVAHSAVADELAPKTMLTRAQMEGLLHKPEHTRTPFDSTRAGRYIVVDYDRMLPIAPGVVLIKAPGHTPGSQVVYVGLASGREVILSGDVAFNRLGIETERQKPDSASRHMAEDRAAIASELAWLRQAEQSGVSVVVSHDGEQVATFARRGILIQGLATSR